MMQRVMIIAGEASGDMHGAGVVRELKRHNPSMEIFGIGGDAMAREGMTLAYHVRELSFMGFVEVIQHLPLIRSVEKTLEQLLKLKKPEVVVLIDYPGFNLRFARTIKRYGIKVVYYISPQVWAWKKSRIKKMCTLIDKMLVVFPFEVTLYQKEKIPVVFVGHPLLEELHVTLSREEFCTRFGLDASKKIIALLPGSRKQEVSNLLSVMVRAAYVLREQHDVEIVVAVAPNLSLEFLQRHIPPNFSVTFVENATHELLHHAHSAIVASGTATLETACFETPMVVVYRTSWLTYLIARVIVHIKNIALVNIVAGKTIVPELIQHHATVQNLAASMNEYFLSDEKYIAVKKELAIVKERLGNAGASKNVAREILAMQSSSL